MYLMTTRGRDKLRQQIGELQEKLGQVILERGGIEGGFHENASAEDNKRRVTILRSQIRDLKKAYRQATMVHPTGDGKVGIGTTVEIEQASGATQTWAIGGYGESDPDNGVIAYDSPLGAALMGARAGETRTFNGKDISIIQVNP